MQRELGALTKSGKALGMSFYTVTLTKKHLDISNAEVFYTFM
jgi:hypothetical protein